MLKIISTPLKLPILFILLVCCLLSACSGNGAVPGKEEGKAQHPFHRLAAMNWQLHSIKRGQHGPASGVASGIPVNRYHLDFIDGRARLRGGCNLVNGIVKINAPGKMQIGPMVMTNRGCNSKAMKADSEIGQTLSYVTHYRLDEDRLLMLGAKRILLFKGMPNKSASYIADPANLRKAKFW